jgi:4-hydroxybenzoate polyprenyltransferase
MHAAVGNLVTTCREVGVRSVVVAALEVLRPYQWLKNLLVFLPLLAAHRSMDVQLLARAFIAFAAFSLCASAIYVTNDLHDVDADAAHPHKKDRPLPSGRLPLVIAWALIPALLVPGVLVGWMVDPRVAAALVAYCVLMFAYSLHLKRVVLLDALVLGGGYALRVVAGGFAVGILPSSRLLAFCVFLFFSLALLKRYAELTLLALRDGVEAHARSYIERDVPPVLAIGTSSGVMSVLVLVLYVSSQTVRTSAHSEVIWATCVLLLYWVSYLWLMAHRGQMTDDPLVFAIKDRVSLVLIGLMGVTAWLAL